MEYKRGKEKHDRCDEAQLCAQGMCLEEMLNIAVPLGYLFYGQPRRRFEVALNSELRNLVEEMAEEMHAYFARGYTPRVKPSKGCKSCSLADLCLPELLEHQETASAYIQRQINGA